MGEISHKLEMTETVGLRCLALQNLIYLDTVSAAMRIRKLRIDPDRMPATIGESRGLGDLG